jgi:5-hydroxyisourate hydrolase
VSSLSTHVLDATKGQPAAGVPVRLIRAGLENGGIEIAAATTDPDGRVARLADGLDAGTYRLVFDTGGYFADTFYPEVVVTFTVAGPRRHYHVPLLLSPYAYSTYRGS